MKHVAPIIFFICAIFLTSFADADQAILAKEASSFLDSIGVQIHITYKDGAYANVKNVLSDLNFLGIKYVRDGVPWHWGPDTSAVSDYVTLARGGVNFDLIVSSGIQIPAGKDFVTQNLNVFKTIISSISPARVSAIEGPNEVDNWPVTYKDAALSLPNTLSATNIFQKQSWKYIS